MGGRPCAFGLWFPTVSCLITAVVVMVQLGSIITLIDDWYQAYLDAFILQAQLQQNGNADPALDQILAHSLPNTSPGDYLARFYAVPIIAIFLMLPGVIVWVMNNVQPNCCCQCFFPFAYAFWGVLNIGEGVFGIVLAAALDRILNETECQTLARTDPDPSVQNILDVTHRVCVDMVPAVRGWGIASLALGILFMPLTCVFCQMYNAIIANNNKGQTNNNMAMSTF